MRWTTFLVLSSIALLFVSTVALPVPKSKSGQERIKPRQVEEELLQGAEDSVELFDTPRIHDSSEKIHEGTAKNNITANRLLESMQTPQEQGPTPPRLSPVLIQLEVERYNSRAGYRASSQQIGPWTYRQRTEYGAYSRQSAYGAYSRQSEYGSYR